MSMDIESARHIAQGVGWLGRTTPDFRAAVLEKSRLKRVRTNEVVYNVGDRDGGLYCLISGGLKVLIAPNEQGPVFVHLMQPGLWTGEGPLVTGRPRLIGLSATRSTVLLYVPLPDIQAILQRDPAAWRFIALLSFGHLQTALGALDDLMVRDPGRRLVAVLLRLAGCRGETTQDTRPKALEVSHGDLAAAANLGRTTVTNTLRELHDARLIDVSYRRVALLNPPALRDMLRDH
jgi:CRP/FNR family transcriptional regulator, cyclic AMP receptor protein